MPLTSELRVGGRVSVTCNYCRRVVPLDLQAMVARGLGDRPLVELPLPCRACGSCSFGLICQVGIPGEGGRFRGDDARAVASVLDIDQCNSGTIANDLVMSDQSSRDIDPQPRPPTECLPVEAQMLAVYYRQMAETILSRAVRDRLLRLARHYEQMARPKP